MSLADDSIKVDQRFRSRPTTVRPTHDGEWISTHEPEARAHVYVRAAHHPYLDERESVERVFAT